MVVSMGNVEVGVDDEVEGWPGKDPAKEGVVSMVKVMRSTKRPRPTRARGLALVLLFSLVL